MISPTEVANMAFVPTDQSLNQTNQFYAQLAAQKEARKDAQRAQEQAAEINFNNKLLEQIGASNTPADEVLIDEGNRIIGDISKYAKNNPRASMGQKAEYARQVLAPYLSKKEMAKSVFGQLEASAKEQSKMYPYANLANYKKDVARDILYDESGNPRPTYNMAALQNPKYNLSDVNILEKYADDTALEPLLQKSYKEGLPLEERVFATKDPQGLMVDVTTKANPLQRLNKDLSSLELNTVPVDVNGKIYEVLPFDVNIPIANKPEYQIAKRRVIKNLINKDANLVNADEDFLSSLADTELAKRYSLSENTKIDKDYKRQEMADAKAYKEQQLALQRRSLSLREQQFAFNKEKVAKQLKDDPYSPKGIYYTITGASKYKDGAPLSQEAEDIVLTKYRTPFDPKVYDATKDFLSKETKSKINKLPKNEDGRIKTSLVSPFVSMVDLSASTKDGLFIDKQKMKPYKLYSVYDNEGGIEPKMVKVYYTPAVKNKVTGQLDPAMPEGDPMLVKDPKQELLTIGDYFNDTKAQVKEQIITPQIMDEE